MRSDLPSWAQASTTEYIEPWRPPPPDPVEPGTGFNHQRGHYLINPWGNLFWWRAMMRSFLGGR